MKANGTRPATGKSRPKSRRVPQPHGGVLVAGAGRGPAKGAPNAGRPPEAFKELCRQYACGALTDAGIGTILRNPDHPQYIVALRWVGEHGYGKPTQPVEHSGKVTLEEILGRSHE